jgi:ubiquinone/menaquinone biosynthesis C-methylase UbiE
LPAKKIKSLAKLIIPKILINLINYVRSKYWDELSDIYLNKKKKYWEQRDIEVAKIYWESRNDKLRNQYLLLIFEEYNPQSFLEIGCNCGNKLYPLSIKYPEGSFNGIDINKAAVDYGNRKSIEEGLTNIKLEYGFAEDLSRYSSNSMSIVFSWATLIYIRPKDISKVLKEMYRIATKAVILIEMHSSEIIHQNEAKGVYYDGNWKRNYVQLFKNIGIKEKKISTKKIEYNIWAPGGGGATLIIIDK